MTRFKHDLILRIIKVLDAVLVTIPFALCWYLYYAKHIVSPFMPRVITWLWHCFLCCSSFLAVFMMHS